MSDSSRLLSHSQEETSNSSANEPLNSRSELRNYDSIQPSTDIIPEDKSTLKLLEKLGFALGHVYNDLCAGIWFSYTLVYLKSVIRMSGPEAGAMMMVGQVGDAISTGIIGFLSDYCGTKRKWHIFGTFLVLISFPLIFTICPFCSVNWWRLFYFSTVILVFQCGWPVVQVSSLAMIPEMSKTQRDRSELTAMRYSGSICSTIVVYLVVWVVLHLQSVDENEIGPQNWKTFRLVVLILTILGVSTTFLFHVSLSASNYETRRQSHPQSDIEPLIESTPQVSILKSPSLYQNAFLFVFARIFVTTSMVFMPLWLTERASGDKTVEYIATVPLASFVASFLAAVLYKLSSRFYGHRIGYLIGSIVSMLACFWIAVVALPTSEKYQLYVVAIFYGCGASVTMIASMSLVADMIGAQASKGGFIYSTVTFCDKLISGIAIVIIETLSTKRCAEENHVECEIYYRHILSYVCAGAAILGVLTLGTLMVIKPKMEEPVIESYRRIDS